MTLLIIAAIVVLFAASIWLAVAETSFLRLNRVRALAMEEEGRKGAARLARMLEHPERTLNVVLLLALFAQLTSSALLGAVLSDLGVWAFVLGLVVNFVAFFVVGEVIPKTWAVQHTDRAALSVSALLAFLTEFPPLRYTVRTLIGLANVILPGRGIKEGPFVTEEDLRTMADVAAEEEAIETEERRLIHSIFEFGDTVVREVMVPRPDMVTVDASFRVVDVMEVVLLNGYSRLPVRGEGIDDVVGLVYAKDLMRAARDGKENERVSTLLRQPRFVPETKRVPELLREMQHDQFHMAIVVDEYGGTAGLVTLEDLIEELVGEIVDEFDVEDPLVEPLPSGDLRVHARTPMDEVNDLLHADLPEGDWDTIGGLLYRELGHVPYEGESVDVGNWRLVAQRIQGRRIGRVLISRVAPADGSGGSHTGGDHGGPGGSIGP